MDVMEPVAVSQKKITYDEFLARCDERNAAEWVDGEIIYKTVSLIHNNLHHFILKLIGSWVEEAQAGQTLSEPFQMKTGPNLPGRSPDVFVLLNEHRDRLRDNHIAGPADLAIEIISPESIGRDRGDKFVEYEQGGVREYWSIDPIRKQTDFFVRGEDGYFRAMFSDDSGIYGCAILPGLWIDVAWFWRDPLASIREVLRAWNLI